MWWKTPIRKSRKKTSHQLSTLLIKQFPIPLIWLCFSDHLLDLLCGTTIWLVGDAHWCMFLWFWCWILYELLGVHCVSTLVSQKMNLSTMELSHINIRIHIQISNFWWLQDSCIFFVCHFYFGINESSMTSVFRFLLAWDSVFCSQEV